jgi:putative ABC transport system ATP-binding protein
MENLIELNNLKRFYQMGEVVVEALRGIDLAVKKGEMLAIMGASGSGKSTLMNILGCLDQPTSGEYFLDGINVGRLTKNQCADIRNSRIGFVFQGFNLLPRTSAIENVELPLIYNRSKKSGKMKFFARQALERVGLGDRIHHEPNQLSGGQQQRVAIARALVNEPSIILADEPTGNLDSKTSVDVLSVFQELNDQGITVILVTHEQDIALFAKRIVRMVDGLICEDSTIKDRKQAKKEFKVD